jgi:hypothetical protein
MLKKMLIAGAALVTLGGGCITINLGNSGQVTVVEDTSPKQYKDLVRFTSPIPPKGLTSPLTVKGEARGTWYFEASFPVRVLDANQNVLGTGIAQAQGDWMTEEYVPFTATITFPNQPSGSKGSLVFVKDNPSGLPEHEDSFTVPVTF